jgi:hypothetical protein
MRFSVTALYRKGVRISRGKKLLTVDGDLNLFSGHNQLLGRVVMEAQVFNDPGAPFDLLPIVDVHVTAIAGDVMVLRGTEYAAVAGGVAEYSQEWAVRQIPVV